MSNFVPNLVLRKRFDGDDVVISARRLRRLEMLKILPALQNMNKQRGIKDKQKQTALLLDTLEKTCDTVEACVEKVEGLNDANGAPIAAETIFRELYFSELALEILTDIVDQSSLGPEDEKG